MLEHNSVLRPLYEMQNRGVSISILKSDRLGNISYEAMEAAIKQETKAIVCTHASNVTGNVLDISRIGGIAKEHGVLLLVDATQTTGLLPINVEEMNIDVLCFTGHKGLLGPQGTGGMVVKKGLIIDPLKTGGSGVDSYNQNQPKEMPSSLEAGTLNSHGFAGLGAALEYLDKVGIDFIKSREQDLMWKFYQAVKEIPGVTIYGDFSFKDRCPIVSLNIRNYDSSEVSDELLITYGISTRPGAHCAPLMHEAFGTVDQGMVRFSFSHFNTIEEIDAAIKAVRELSKEE
jgi:selenocysteine lyase/cysteine desulfurase